MDIIARNAIEQAESELRIAKAQLKIVRILSRVSPSIRDAILTLAADRARREEPRE